MGMLRPPFPLGWSTIPIARSNLCLANTLPVGQSFLWYHADGEYSRAVDGPPRVVCLRQTKEAIHYTAIHPCEQSTKDDILNGITYRWITDYFHLDAYPSLERLYADWRVRDPVLFDVQATGVRVLRQDPWECLVA
jgi:N-glycosylase/DNA lyase